MTRGLWRYESLKILTVGLGILWTLGLVLNFPGVLEILSTGQVTLHWSRVLAGALFSINFAQVLATLCTLKIIRALHQRQPFLQQKELL